jgi:hypothetical protein
VNEGLYGVLAQAVLFVHALFIAFVAGGGFLVLRWPKLAWIHVPCLLWGVAIVIGGWICPLTPLELALRERAGMPLYSGGFLDQYLMPWVYPERLGQAAKVVLGLLTAAVNAAIYLRLHRRRR